MNNNLNEFAPEKRYSYSIMDEIKVSMMRSGDKKEIQKRKFELVSKLVSDLFKYKGRKGCYNTISNLIISSLISFDDSPIDIFSDEDDYEEEMDESCKKILERELFEFSNDLPN
ncbi:MAG: hypothetical protein GF317_13170 [Candidatus Lokiarchaeota archaeon]|nr:hypothetical protein [Candidatus Lokiarchaeota archaeon]MBD3200587.1 hypothetical protein [Candidatus Lokiarchaeota archaeon]